MYLAPFCSCVRAFVGGYFERPTEGSYRGIRRKFREYLEYAQRKGKSGLLMVLHYGAKLIVLFLA